MPSDFPRMAFPNESAKYRQARNGLLDAVPEGRGAGFFPKVVY